MQASASVSRPVVIITGLKIGGKSTTVASRVSSAMAAFASAFFGEKAATVAAVIATAAMYWHIISIDDAIAMGEAIATDAICALPWGIAAIIRSFSEKGGKE